MVRLRRSSTARKMRILPWILLALVLAIVFSAGYFLGASLSTGPKAIKTPSDATVKGEIIGRTLNASALAIRDAHPVLVNHMQGTVTEVLVPEPVHARDALYRVNDLPVVALSSQIPFYRDLGGWGNLAGPIPPAFVTASVVMVTGCAIIGSIPAAIWAAYSYPVSVLRTP